MVGAGTLAGRIPRGSGHFDFPVSYVFLLFLIIVVVIWAWYMKPKRR